MTNSDPFQKHRRQAIRLVRKERFKAAVKPLQELLKLKPVDYEVHFYLALSLYESGRFAKSLQHWKELNKIGPKQKNVNLNLGCAYHALGNTANAVRHYKKELEINPVSGEALYSLGALFFERHRYRDALKYLEACYYLRHSVDTVIHRLAYSYSKTKQIDKEINLYQERLQTHPGERQTLGNLGVALMDKGDYNRACLYLKKATRNGIKVDFFSRKLREANTIRQRIANRTT